MTRKKKVRKELTFEESMELEPEPCHHLNILLFICGEGKEDVTKQYEKEIKNIGKHPKKKATYESLVELNKRKKRLEKGLETFAGEDYLVPETFATPQTLIVDKFVERLEAFNHFIIDKHIPKLKRECGVYDALKESLKEVVERDRNKVWYIKSGINTFKKIVYLCFSKDRLHRLMQTPYFKFAFDKYKEQLLKQQLTNTGIKKIRLNLKLIFNICSKSPIALEFLVSGRPIDEERIRNVVKGDIFSAIYKIIAKYDYLTISEEESWFVGSLFKKVKRGDA